MKKTVNKKDLKTSFDQMAEYFDHTDTTDMEWEDTNASFERPELTHISVRIPKEDLLKIKRNAHHLGLGYTAYIRMILHQHASEERTTAKGK